MTRTSRWNKRSLAKQEAGCDPAGFFYAQARTISDFRYLFSVNLILHSTVQEQKAFNTFRRKFHFADQRRLGKLAVESAKLGPNRIAQALRDRYSRG
jgi:hypothetical protein